MTFTQNVVNEQAVTQAASTNNTTIATTAFVQTATQNNFNPVVSMLFTWAGGL